MVPLGVAALRDVRASRATALLAVGDVAAVVGVLVLGMARHDVNPVESPEHAALVVAPFLLGWLVGAPLAGAYAESTLAARSTVLWSGAIGWFVAALVGLDFRATATFPGGVTGLFGFVMTGFGLLAVVGWRLVFTLLVRRGG